MSSEREAREALLRRLYAAHTERDIEGAVALLAPDVIWPNVMEQRVEHGRDAVRSYWTRQFTMIDPHVEATGFTHDVGGDPSRVAVTVHQVVRLLDGTLRSDAHVVHTFTFGAGGIVAMEVGPAPA